MKKILFVISAIILIVSIFVSGGCVGCRIYLAEIIDVDIWADNSSPTEYFVDVVSVETVTCMHFDSCNTTRSSNTTIIVEVFHRVCPTQYCEHTYNEVEHTISLGSDFVVGVMYTVEVNNVTETFIAPIM